jgi:hypothetical protein
VRYAFDVLRHALVLGVAGLSIAARGPGCGGFESSSAGLNAPCTRDTDCESGLLCQAGVCTGPLEDAAPPPEAGPSQMGDAAPLPDGAPQDGAVDG